MIRQTLILLSICIWLISCNTNEQQKADASQDLKSQVSGDVDSAMDESYLIDDDSFYGIQVGSKIADIPESKISKSTAKNAEGTYDMYQIMDGGDKIGYFSADPLSQDLVGAITVTTDKASTKYKIGIGTTYKEIKIIQNIFEVHGSEIENKTHVKYGNLSFGLDYPSNVYLLDKEEIPETAKVIDIVINRNAESVK